MAAGNSPIVVHEVLTLTSLGIEPRFITFNHVTMESDKYIVVYESEPENRLAMIDMEMPTTEPLRTPMVADSALMNPDTRIIALKASKMPRNSKGHITGEVHDFVHIFNIENQIRKKIRSCELSEQVEFWKWITPKVLGMVTHASVYHWSIEDDYGPIKVFDRADNLAGNQIVNYRCDPTEKWLVLIGLAPGSSQAPQLVKGNMQLFYVDEHRSQVPGNENPSTLICYASKEIDGGGITSKLHLVELGARPGKPCGDEWQVRYKIIKGICQGLQYLHKIRINHLDLKPGNILLDVGMEPKIADFGLSRCFDEEQSRVFTKHIYGTRGYIAPEIINNGEISFKSDIFALGIIIIKLLTGHNDYDIENWHKSLNVDCPQVRRCIEIAQACVDDDQHKRPAIDEIIHKLDELETVVDSPAKIQMQFRNRCNSETM